jgi:hypothetical protein
MNKKIADYVEELFAGTLPEPKVLEIKEELLAALNDKYLDLLESGKSEEEAYGLVVSGIGNVAGLLRDFTEPGPYSRAEEEKKHNLRSVFLSIGVALFVLSLAVCLLFVWAGQERAGLFATVLCWAVATGLIVYGVNLGKPRYEKRDDTFVERYKEKASAREHKRRLRKAVNSALWPLLVAIYLALSFISGRWDITWILFVIGAALQMFIHWLFLSTPAQRGKYWHGMFWCSVTAIYFIISFAFRAWAWSWIMFVVAVALQQIIMLIRIWGRKA